MLRGVGKGVVAGVGQRRMFFKEHLFSVMDEKGLTLEELYEKCAFLGISREEFRAQCFAEATDLYPSYLNAVIETLGLSKREADLFSVYYGFGRTPLEKR